MYRNQRGFLLIECAVAFLLLTFSSSLFMYYHYQVFSYALSVEKTITALFLARSYIEQYRAFKTVALATLEKKGYLATAEFLPSQKAPGLLLLSVTVSWDANNSICLKALVE